LKSVSKPLKWDLGGYSGIFVLLAGSGFASFQLIAYHVKTQAIISDAQIPILYAVAMGVDAIVALIIGKTYDKRGLMVLVAIPVLTLPIPFLGFSHAYGLIILAIVLWGAVMAIHETIMRAAIADLVPIERRGSAYGIFNTLYGLSLFIGSAAMGFLYEVSIRDCSEKTCNLLKAKSNHVIF
jgi:MFS family permease